MTIFEGGPANGQRLMLHRAPLFLRVVEVDGKWDALDQLDDVAASNETVYAYEITDRPGHCHVNFGGGRGGFYPIATYRFIPDQPADQIMRLNGDWREWCQNRQPKYVQLRAAK